MLMIRCYCGHWF